MAAIVLLQARHFAQDSQAFGSALFACGQAAQQAVLNTIEIQEHVTDTDGSCSSLRVQECKEGPSLTIIESGIPGPVAQSFTAPIGLSRKG